METATKTKRVLAFLIDHFLLCMIAASLAFISFGSNWDERIEIAFAQYTIVALIVIAYISKDVIGGASIGKRLLNIQVVSYDNELEKVVPAKLLLRNTLVFMWPLEFLVLIFSKENRRIGDFIAGTRVVVSRVVEKKAKIKILSAIAIVLASVFLYLAITAKNLSSYKTARTYVTEDELLQAQIGEIERFGFFPSVSVQISNTRSIAVVSFSVEGTNASRYVRAKLERNAGMEWTVVDIEYIE